MLGPCGVGRPQQTRHVVNAANAATTTAAATNICTLRPGMGGILAAPPPEHSPIYRAICLACSASIASVLPVLRARGMQADEVARRIFESYRSGDLAAIQGLVSSEVVVHMPGDNVLAGEYKGLGVVLALVARAAAYFEPRSIRLLGVDVNEGEIEARVEVGAGLLAATGGPLQLTQRMHFNERGQISEAWIEPDDPCDWDDFVGRLPDSSGSD